MSSITRSQAEKGKAFRELHQRDRAFIIPNPWDPGSAKILESLGFEALATTSAGYAFSLGRRDNSLERQQVLGHIEDLATATHLPISADLENGFGEKPEAAAETIRLAVAAGAVGGSIEDATGRPDKPVYEKEFAAERIRAAAEAARSFSFPFTLTARAENYLYGRFDIRDTIARLQAYQEAGANVLYAPGISTREEIHAAVAAVDLPVNVLMGLKGARFSVNELSDLGVRRVSVGSALARAALGELLRAAREMSEHGTFQFAERAASMEDISKIFQP
jgi:2-methylisocitrate lyase-like PEP mutase family enzyme